jgi:hypothetical protein
MALGAVRDVVSGIVNGIRRATDVNMIAVSTNGARRHVVVG